MLMIFGLSLFIVVLAVSKAAYDQSKAISSASAGSEALGSGEASFNIVGESHYQKEILQAAGFKSWKEVDEDGVDEECEVVLTPEPNNQYDANAVAVLIDGEKVGYLSRPDAKRYRKQFGSDRKSCPATICGGFMLEAEEGDRRKRAALGVKLDFQLP